jgi:hypothetical protein
MTCEEEKKYQENWSSIEKKEKRECRWKGITGPWEVKRW